MYTIVFNVFIMMQLFNMINARKLGERQFNIFADLFNNWMFIAIYIIMWIVQFASVQYGGRPLRTVPLSMDQTAVCLAIGSFSLVWGFLIKFIPGAWFDWVRMPEHEMEDKEETTSMVATLKRSMRQSRASRNSSRRSNGNGGNGQQAAAGATNQYSLNNNNSGKL